MPELLELAARCEAAEGPDRRLDVAIVLALGLGTRIPGSAPDGSQDGFHEFTGGASSLYTASLDAAMTLKPEDWILVELRHVAPSNWYAGFARSDADHVEGEAFAPAGPLALCAAALRARAADHA